MGLDLVQMVIVSTITGSEDMLSQQQLWIALGFALLCELIAKLRFVANLSEYFFNITTLNPSKF